MAAATAARPPDASRAQGGLRELPFLSKAKAARTGGASSRRSVAHASSASAMVPAASSPWRGACCFGV